MKRLVVIAIVLVGLGASSAQASHFEIVLPAKEAVDMAKRTGASVHSCKRTAPRHFRCLATYWYERHEAEEPEPGVLVEIASEPVREDVVLNVGLSGVFVSASS